MWDEIGNFLFLPTSCFFSSSKSSSSEESLELDSLEESKLGGVGELCSDSVVLSSNFSAACYVNFKNDSMSDDCILLYIELTSSKARLDGGMFVILLQFKTVITIKFYLYRCDLHQRVRWKRLSYTGSFFWRCNILGLVSKRQEHRFSILCTYLHTVCVYCKVGIPICLKNNNNFKI